MYENFPEKSALFMIEGYDYHSVRIVKPAWKMTQPERLQGDKHLARRLSETWRFCSAT